MSKFGLPEALNEYFELTDTQLGAGTFGMVVLAKHRITEEHVAIKIFDKKLLNRELPRAYAEIKALHALSHQHIVQLYLVYEDSDNIFLIMEYLPGGELFDYIVSKTRVNEIDARIIFRQIVSAVAYMHGKNFVHRDLKPENILLDEFSSVKIVDFGLSANPQGGIGSLLETNCGSLAYAAPELFDKKYKGSETDVWTLGVLLYVILCGVLPFDSDCYEGTITKIKNADFYMPEDLSQDAQQLLNKMICINPAARITIWELLSDQWLQHGFGAPIEWISKTEKPKVELPIIESLSKLYQIPLAEIKKQLDDRVLSNVTCHYYLAVRRMTRCLADSFVDASSLRKHKNRSHSLSDDEMVFESEFQRFAQMQTPMKSSHNSLDFSIYEGSFEKHVSPKRKPMSPSMKTQFTKGENNPQTMFLMDKSLNYNSSPMNKTNMIFLRNDDRRHNTSKINDKSLPLKFNRKIFNDENTPQFETNTINVVGGGGGVHSIITNTNMDENKPKRNFFNRIADAFKTRKHAPDNTNGGNSWADKHKKNNNIVWTHFQCTDDAVSVITETFYLLTKRGLVQNFELKNKIFRCKCRYGHNLKTTVELEVVYSKEKGVGIRRKRISGDSWAYINICKTLFNSCAIESDSE